MEDLNRRSFLGLAAGAAACAGCAGAGTAPVAQKAPDFIWAVMFKLGGNNMAGDAYLTADWPQKNPKIRHRIRFKELFFDESIWREATERMAKGGLNMALIDMHEGVVYPRHPEIAVKGSWSPEKFRAEMARLRAMGITPVPKLNFSTTHAAWQGEWRYRTSTPAYYTFCDDMIQDVCDLFDTPPLFHLGMDEEIVAGQQHEPFCVIRQGLRHPAGGSVVARSRLPGAGRGEARRPRLDLERQAVGGAGGVREALPEERDAVELVLQTGLQR